MLSYDFFLAHAAADAAQAERLYDLLCAETRVFLDTRSLILGDDWDQMLAEAQRNSRVTVVLVSASTDTAFYQREEIAAAIDLARTNTTMYRVVPVYLDTVQASIPYGLRLKTGLVVSSSLPLEQVATRLLDLHRMLVAQLPEPTAAHVAAPLSQQAPSQSELLEQLFDGDPVVSLPAAEGLAEHDSSIVPDVVRRLSGLNVISIFAIRMLLSRFPEESARLMADRILDAYRDWQGVTHIPECFTPRHRPFCADFLAGYLDDSQPDVVRKCIESLGFMAAETWGFRLVELLDSSDRDYYRKYASYVILARARMLAQLEADPAGIEWQLPSAFTDVEYLIAEASRRGWHGIQYPQLRDMLAKCQPRHADHLITSWLAADLVERRALAARALGQMRLRRSLPYLVDRVKSARETDQVRQEAVMAIANIGGPDAVTALEELLEASGDDQELSPSLRWALPSCLADASDDNQFARLARDIFARPSSEVCFLHRAVGVRRDERFTSELHRGLQSTDSAVRGQCALALARMGDTGAHGSLVRSYAEAASTLERIQVCLALLLLGEPVPGDPELRRLRADLSQQSFLYKRLITDDILQVLSASAQPQAASIAEGWRAIYAQKLDY